MVADCRRDSLIQMAARRTWEIELPNGDYLVNLMLGDPRYAADKGIRIEDRLHGHEDPKAPFHVLESVPVELSDGRLTLEGVKGNCPVCFIEIVPAKEGFPKRKLAKPSKAKQLAFPGAEGFGKFVSGGRGGEVYHVTNLNWTGPGSLAWGVQSIYGGHPRTVVFDVSGHISARPGDGPLRFNAANLTIAGQTAPGNGITIRDQPVIATHSSNLILRYLRLRLGDEKKGEKSAPDTMTMEDCDGVILDHLSLSWSIDGLLDTRRMGPFTVQWCVFAEPLNHSLHPKGSHGYLMSFRSLDHSLSIHHNLFSSGTTRHPTLGDSTAELNAPGVICDFRNNVVYNWGGGNLKAGATRINLVNNVFRPGSSSRGKTALIAVQAPESQAWLHGNVWNSHLEELTADCVRLTADNHLGAHYKYANGGDRSTFEAGREFGLGEFSIPDETAMEAFETVLQHAGASLSRDAADSRMTRNVRAGKGRIIDSQKDVGGWDEKPSVIRPADFDTDQDGMPDAWEKARSHLDPNNPDDRNGDENGDGYTNLEEYLNALATRSGR